MGLFKQSIEVSETVLVLQPMHPKSCYRKAKALTALNQFDQAKEIFEMMSLPNEVDNVKLE